MVEKLGLSALPASRGKRAQRIETGNNMAQMIYEWLRQLEKPSDAMNVLCSVQAMMCVQCRDRARGLAIDEAQIRAMMGNMTDNVVHLILGADDEKPKPN